MSDLDNALAHLERGLSYAHGDIYDRAIEHLTLAINQGLDIDDEFEARRWRSICFGQTGRVKEALADADWLIDHGDERRYMWRAHLKERLHDYTGAISDYTRAIELDPEHAYMYTFLKRGHAHFGAKMYSEAINDFTMALSLEDTPSVLEAIYGWRGKAYVELGQYQTGLDDFQRAVELAGSEPHVTGYYFHRGLARERLGDPEGAISDYRRAIIDPDHPEAARVKRLIEQLD